jgi:hypothetical protein
MDIVLKEADIVRLLASALGLSLDVKDVTIQGDPLTVTIANAELYFAKREDTLPRKSAVPEVEEEADSAPPEGEPLLTLEDIARINAGLAATPPELSREPRRLKLNETREPPPPSRGGVEER